jgi:hypothetical protein|tara:strand:- start:15713 stop:15901 length:189 start_codon:yes stop_codon:yes gene_type:complete
MNKSQYRIPDGHGKTNCILWTDWLKFKHSKPELWWTEDTPLVIFPDCKLNYKLGEDDDDNGP